MESIRNMLTEGQYQSLIRQIQIDGVEVCDLSVDKLGYVLGYVAACTRNDSLRRRTRNEHMSAKCPARKKLPELPYVECSCCGARHYCTDGSERRMLRDLTDRGWKLYDDGGVLCPECVAAVRETREGR